MGSFSDNTGKIGRIDIDDNNVSTVRVVNSDNIDSIVRINLSHQLQVS